MAEHAMKRPEMEPRRASDSVADIATQTEEEEAPEQQNKSIARARSLDRSHQLARRPLAGEAQVFRDLDDTVAPQQRHDRGGAPAVRLDMDLDVDINMRAKIKGELELSIL